MTRWFYFQAADEGGWWSGALRARSIHNARRELARQYPHATILTLEH